MKQAGTVNEMVKIEPWMYYDKQNQTIQSPFINSVKWYRIGKPKMVDEFVLVAYLYGMMQMQLTMSYNSVGQFIEKEDDTTISNL